MTIFGEVLTAMVTPFYEDFTVNYEGVRKLARYLVENGSDGLVVLGTTGESPTLTKEEKLEILRVVKDEVGEKARIIAGTGTNATKAAIEMTIEAEKVGVDGVMLVCPYYNKPPQEGLYQHFKSIAESTGLPIMIYNVPGRTGKNIEAETIARLAEIDNIVAVKEASGNLNQVSKIRSLTSPDFAIYSGDDSLTLPILAVGGTGVVSVASHVVGNQIKEMIKLFKAGKVREASLLHCHLLPIFQGIFITTNPIPIKFLLNKLGHQVGPVRPPLVNPTEEESKYLLKLLQSIKK
ncbi:4-hydroxy-tetrahydrodipicolinate synthase [Anoxybacter fermentans]|uniref:4-hydroxy-tetrahydrodipicolinate synthase n=1 Tax=Anoxybacter fermentans TaxID=1323375 RepID=A0A3Q9HPB4_9FIRM|nr:4-hydroxy-tetrahydrodipicolinate synthase [Anoxybacter fermentans]AZR72419.1 4-hydroxy-tetrahydrodipicolinate synthase [Anoxybacter fermentans]